MLDFLFQGCVKCGKLRARALLVSWKKLKVTAWSYPKNCGIQLELIFEDPDPCEDDPYRYA